MRQDQSGEISARRRSGRDVEHGGSQGAGGCGCTGAQAGGAAGEELSERRAVEIYRQSLQERDCIAEGAALRRLPHPAVLLVHAGPRQHDFPHAPADERGGVHCEKYFW